MPTLTADQQKLLRSWVGEVVPTVTLQERYDRLGDLDDVVLEELRSQLAVLISDGASRVSVDGIMIDNTENIRSMERRISSFLASGGLGDTTAEMPTGGNRISKISRPDYSR